MDQPTGSELKNRGKIIAIILIYSHSARGDAWTRFGMALRSPNLLTERAERGADSYVIGASSMPMIALIPAAKESTLAPDAKV